MSTTIKQVRSLLGQADSIISQYGLNGESETVLKLIDKTESRQINLMVCGEFKRGKSSFINAFLNENICPENIGIATSAISIISYGETPKVIRHFGKLSSDSNESEDSKVEMQKEEIQLADISKYVDGTAIDIQDTIMLEIQIPNEMLKNGLRLIDSPGVGSLDPRHLFLTLYALPKADIIYFMTDVEEPLQGTELAFYRDRIASTGKVNRILVNKSDLKRKKDVDTIIKDIKDKISDSSVEVMPVSAKLWKEYNQDHTNIDSEESSHCQEIQSVISKDLIVCEKFISESIRSRFIAVMNKLLSSIDERKIAITNFEDIEAKKTELQSKLSEIKQIRDNVSNPDSEIRRKISQILKSSQKDVLSTFSKESVLLSSLQFDEILKCNEALGDEGESFVVSRINEAITDLAAKLDVEINASIERACNLIGKEIENTESIFDGHVYEGITPLQQSFSDKVMALTRQALPVMGVGGIASTLGAAGVGLAGGLLGVGQAAILAAAPYVAIPIGIAAGITFLVKSIKDNKRQTTIAHLRSQIAPRITIAMNELRQYVQNRYDDFNDLLVQSLKDSAEQMSKQMQAVFESIKQCEAGVQERKAEEKMLDNQIKFVKGLIAQAQVFNTNPFTTK